MRCASAPWGDQLGGCKPDSKQIDCLNATVRRGRYASGEFLLRALCLLGHGGGARGDDMGRSVVEGGVILSVVIGIALSGGVAAASGPDYSGQTYGKAAKQISGWGTPIIASVVGDQLVTDDCIVTSSKMGSFLDPSGRPRKSQVLLNLNCNGSLAGPGKPGNSLASPQGKKMKDNVEAANNLNKDLTSALAAGTDPWCASESHAQTCKNICDISGECSTELLDYLASR